MGWNGSGTFTRTKDWTDDKDAGIKILSSRHDENDDELEAGIQACLTKNGETKTTADFSPNANNTYSLGTTLLRWVNLHLITGLKLKANGGSYTTTVTHTTATADRTQTLQDATGTIALKTDAKVVQTVEGTPDVAWQSESLSVIPNDDTIPQNTEGAEIVTVAITPTSVSSRLVIEADIPLSGDAARTLILALFQDSTADALAVAVQTSPAAGNVMSVHLRHEMAAGTTSATTFKARVGVTTGGTVYINGTNAARSFGGVLASRIRVTEYL